MSKYLKSVASKYSFWRLLGVETRFSLTLTSVLGLLPVLIIPCLLAFASLFSRTLDKNDPETDLFALTDTAVTFFIFIKSISSIYDNTKLDKNRIVFLHYGKNKIILVKLIMEIVLFGIAFLLITIMANIFSLRRDPHTSFHFARFNANVFLALPGYLLVYVLIIQIARWIIAVFSIQNRGLIFGIAILTAIVLILPIFLNEEPQTTSYLHGGIYRPTDDIANSWFAKNKMITVWLPFFNLGLITGGGMRFKYRLLQHDWYTLIPFLYSAIFLLSTWQFQATTQKKYLVTG